MINLNIGLFIFSSFIEFIVIVVFVLDMKKRFFDIVEGRLRRVEMEVDEIGRKFINK